MEQLSIILIIIGAAVLIFSIWSHLIIRNHINKYNASGRVSQGLNDAKFFELKSRQDYIVAASALIFAVISFIGYGSITDIKSDLKKQFADETKRMDSSYNAQKAKLDTMAGVADETNRTFSGLKIVGKDLKDSMRSALSLVSFLKNRVGQISKKDVIRQNLFIVDALRVGDFPDVQVKGFGEFKYVAFNKLTTISGQKLPVFSEAPSIVVFSRDGAMLTVKNLTNEGFSITPNMGMYLTAEEAKVPENENGNNIRFTVWISQKGDSSSFSDGFSDDFK